EPGYLGKDIAYHVQSLRERAFDKKIDIWGSNTHYHLIQMRAAMKVLGLLDRFEVVLYQYVRFLHEGVLKRMARRSGEFLLLELVRLALRLPELVDDIRQHYGVHQLTTYALELAGAFHGFYRDHRVVDDADVPHSKARLRLVLAVQVALRQTLGLIGVSAPDKL